MLHRRTDHEQSDAGHAVAGWLDWMDARVLPAGRQAADYRERPLAYAFPAGAFEICLAIAFVYPIMAATIGWLTGLGAPVVGSLTVFPAAVPLWQRLAVAVGMGLVALFAWQSIRAGPERRRLDHFLFFTAMATAVSAAIAGLGGIFGAAIVVGADVASLVVAGAAAGAVPVALTAAVAAAAFASIGAHGIVATAAAGAGMATVAGAIAGTLVFQIAVLGLSRMTAPAKRLATLVGALAGLVVLTLVLLETPERRRTGATLLVFYAALPVVNALFDFVSLGVTRHLMRRSTLDRRDEGLSYAAAASLDLAAGATLTGLLVLATAAVLSAIDGLALRIAGVALIDLPVLVGQIRTDPAGLTWLYLTFFSTMLPTSMHLAHAARRFTARLHPAAVRALLDASVWTFPVLVPGAVLMLWKDAILTAIETMLR